MGAKSGRAKSPDPGRHETNSHTLEEDQFGHSFSCKLRDSLRASLLGGVGVRKAAPELVVGVLFAGGGGGA